MRIWRSGSSTEREEEREEGHFLFSDLLRLREYGEAKLVPVLKKKRVFFSVQKKKRFFFAFQLQAEGPIHPPRF
jgi:hypothetical protein